MNFRYILFAALLAALTVTACRPTARERKEAPAEGSSVENIFNVERPSQLNGTAVSTCGSNTFLLFMFIPKGKKGVLQVRAGEANVCDITIKRTAVGTSSPAPLAEIKPGENFIVDFDAELHGNITLSCKWAEGESKKCSADYSIIYF